MLSRLIARPASVSELAESFDMTLPSFMQHLRTLETAGLVRSHKVGRVRTYRITPEPLALAEDWLTQRRAEWEQRLDRLDAHLGAMKEKES